MATEKKQTDEVLETEEKKKTKMPFARICYFVFICAIVSKIFYCFW